MNLIVWSLLGLGLWMVLEKKPATAPVVPGTGATPLPSTPIQPVTNTVGADEQVAIALASHNPAQMQLLAAQLRAQGYTSQATTLENAAIAASGVSSVSSILKDLGL